MDIPLTPLTPENRLNTDIMPDLKALILEKGYELHKICAENGIMHLIILEGYMHHWHMTQKKPTPFDTELFWRWINWVIHLLSAGNYSLQFKVSPPLPSQEPPDPSENWKNG